MKTLMAVLLATVAGASAAAPTWALNHDPDTYRNALQKVNADYQAAMAKCDGKSGNDKDVCTAEAKLDRTRAEASALSQYNNTPISHQKVRASLADAEYAVAKAKCGGKSGADKDGCMDSAKAAHTAALTDAKDDRGAATATGSSGGNGSTASASPVVTTDKAAAADKCAQADAKTGCLVQTKTPGTTAAAAADRTAAAADTAADSAQAAAATASDKTRVMAANAGEKTREVAQAAVDKTKEVAHTVAQKTETAMDGAADSTAGKKAEGAAARTRVAAADTAITTKVKAGLVKEPNLKSLGIHVETDKGVVMLSGFVNSKDEADRAVKVAKGVSGVSKVRSAIEVK